MLLRSGAMTRSLPALMVAIAGALAAPGALAASGETAMDVACRIRTSEQDGFLTLQAFATSDAPVDVTYRLQIAKRSASGSSQNVQSGRVSLQPGHDQILSTVVFEASARNAFTARLDIEWDKGTRTCSAP